MLLMGCASTNDYNTYVESQKILNRDLTMIELARISALTEIIKNTTDSEVRIRAIEALEELQRNGSLLTIEPPKSWLGR